MALLFYPRPVPAPGKRCTPFAIRTVPFVSRTHADLSATTFSGVSASSVVSSTVITHTVATYTVPTYTVAVS